MAILQGKISFTEEVKEFCTNSERNENTLEIRGGFFQEGAVEMGLKGRLEHYRQK